MSQGDLLILSGQDVEAILDGREDEVMGAVEAAYLLHGAGDSTLPHSAFLRFPGNQRDRIISLIGYLGGEFRTAGMKWIASFPENPRRGIARASAVMVLNSVETGRPEVFMEGSLVSARRTAASAALAARVLHQGEPESVGIIGCGLISLEVVRFIRAVWPRVDRYVVFDLSAPRAAEFVEEIESAFPGVRGEVAESVEAVLAGCAVVSLATTALEPHIQDLSICPRGATLLHLSLRDIAAGAVLRCDNVVDDVDHVLRAGTSLHLAEERTGSRDHVRCTLADVLDGRAPARRSADDLVVFSPFGLGVLDLAVGKLVADRAAHGPWGTRIDSFFPGFARVHV